MISKYIYFAVSVLRSVEGRVAETVVRARVRWCLSDVKLIHFEYEMLHVESSGPSKLVGSSLLL